MLRAPQLQTSDQRKAEFLAHFGHSYGLYYSADRTQRPKEYPLDQFFEKEFQHLQNSTYLDHTGTTLYSQTQIQQCNQLLSTSVFGNPHSTHDASKKTSEIIKRFRGQVMKFFNTDSSQYDVVFTHNSSHACYLISQLFPWSSKSSYAYTQHNHNSIVGIRQAAIAKGAKFQMVNSHSFLTTRFFPSTKPNGNNCSPTNGNGSFPSVSNKQNLPDDAPCSLIGFPAQCNFSGKKFPPELIRPIQDGDPEVLKQLGLDPTHRWFVFFDPAAFAGTSVLDLGSWPADFCCISFYKMFGYPSGLGALLIHKRISKRLVPLNYFAGGTVTSVTASKHISHASLVRKLEFGTLPFTTIAQAAIGLEWLKNLHLKSPSKIDHWNPSMFLIENHMLSLHVYLETALSQLAHSNGQKMVILYGRIPNKPEIRPIHKTFGGILAMQLFDPAGNYIPRSLVENILGLEHVAIRSGAFCNYGANSYYLGLSDQETLSVATPNPNQSLGHTTYGCSKSSFVASGKPFGSIRVSMGYMTRFEDIDRFLQVLCTHFQDIQSKFISSIFPENPSLPLYTGKTPLAFIKSINVFPIKSCQGFSPAKWAFSPRSGLLYDREWMLVDLSGACYSVKRLPTLYSLTAKIEGTNLIVTNRSASPESMVSSLVIPINSNPVSPPPTYQPKSWVKTPNLSSELNFYPDHINQWFSKALGTECLLVRVKEDSQQLRTAHGSSDCTNPQKVKFSNRSQYLVITEPSVEYLTYRIPNTSPEETDHLGPDLFRANFLLGSHNNQLTPFMEDIWESLDILSESGKKISLKCSGDCQRCEVICYDSKGIRHVEPMKTLLQFRRHDSKLVFGQHLVNVQDIEQNNSIEVGNLVYAHFSKGENPDFKDI